LEIYAPARQGEREKSESANNPFYRIYQASLCKSNVPRFKSFFLFRLLPLTALGALNGNRSRIISDRSS
jgi:hypothetical protein